MVSSFFARQFQAKERDACAIGCAVALHHARTIGFLLVERPNHFDPVRESAERTAAPSQTGSASRSRDDRSRESKRKWQKPAADRQKWIVARSIHGFFARLSNGRVMRRGSGRMPGKIRPRQGALTLPDRWGSAESRLGGVTGEGHPHDIRDCCLQLEQIPFTRNHSRWR
jgi:hypothetical protein